MGSGIAEAPADERSPLLQAPRPHGGGRVRIHSGAASPRVPHLSRNHSYTGTSDTHHLQAQAEALLLALSRSLLTGLALHEQGA